MSEGSPGRRAGWQKKGEGKVEARAKNRTQKRATQQLKKEKKGLVAPHATRPDLAKESRVHGGKERLRLVVSTVWLGVPGKQEGKKNTSSCPSGRQWENQSRRPVCAQTQVPHEAKERTA